MGRPVVFLVFVMSLVAVCAGEPRGVLSGDDAQQYLDLPLRYRADGTFKIVQLTGVKNMQCGAFSVE